LALARAAPLAAIIVGAGFGGLGMAIALRKAGVEDFLLLEKAADVGGVWRDNSYPGAACDVPSHLYSFSFEPNPAWSRAFAPQREIFEYLQHCARKYDLQRHLRFGSEVQQARFDEQHDLWTLTLVDGTILTTRLLISATGQLSRPKLPTVPGLADFQGRSFHSAAWDHGYGLAGKRVAVVGTGASALQIVPAIAGTVQQLTVFQRSPGYIMPRQNRAYSALEMALCRWLPWTMTLHRAGIYLAYESRAIAFTRLQGLLKWVVGLPFKRMLARQVSDPGLRAQLMPDYPIGCKRILLSSQYLATLAKPNVALVTAGIRRVTADSIETADGKRHRVDAIIYGTGFAASEFLAPMRVIGRSGLALHDAWRGGAKAWYGLSVPGFPNFFMLYGPNTNLGHNSIVYMLESQIAHVMRCCKAMKAAQASRVEVDAAACAHYNLRIQQRLARSVWHGCSSWYVDEAGHNANNWPGFTLSYRWRVRYAGLDAYRFSSGVPAGSAALSISRLAEPQAWPERWQAAFQRGFLRACFRTVIGPPYGPLAQRLAVRLLSPLMPGARATTIAQIRVGDLPVEVVTPRGDCGSGVMLYLHGGAFCLGSPSTHRSITTHLAIASGMPLWVPDYRLAPEHPYPAALQDVQACYHALLAKGYQAQQIVLAGDSAGGALALALALTLRASGATAPAALLLMSPVTDPTLAGPSLQTQSAADPMIRQGWLEQGLRWYNCPFDAPVHQPLAQDLHGLPPMLIQVGEQEILLSDSTRLAEHAARCGVACRLEIHAARWHVFHLQSFYLRSAVRALQTLGAFARERVAAAKAQR
jgi:cation diffusion facilitator CzcD-associated flavoprotein CzcO/acetyl esterase/lipase